MSSNQPPPSRAQIDTRAWLLLVGSSTLLMVVYFTIPLRSVGTDHPVLGWLLFVAALVVLSALLMARMSDVVRGTGRHPGVWLVFLICLSMTIFAATYYVLGSKPDEFVGLESRLDALYFTIVTMSTVGYGDITPAGQAPRLVVMLQIAYNFVFLAAAAGVLSRQIRTGMETRTRRRHPEDGA
ncbi:potassium channel family protein [Kitasatospora sp. CM 4170]|uniref:Potassium channel family protein n=1 Tax=Kitasatospora aburaviensis TaxID=67265 RepID=A0ABW1F5L2_9ACTN|nr:potassium channel family protein [Kitasatospora sp. CM 4170]WNM46515.1 potassium channel family protein [Kitasatospora sp. CM 4170]